MQTLPHIIVTTTIIFSKKMKDVTKTPHKQLRVPSVVTAVSPHIGKTSQMLKMEMNTSNQSKS